MSSQPLARSRQQLQQSRPMGERQSSSDMSKWAGGRKGEKKKSGAQVWIGAGAGISAEAEVCE